MRARIKRPDGSVLEMAPSPEMKEAGEEAFLKFAQERFPDARVDITPESAPRIAPVKTRADFERECFIRIETALQGKSASMLRQATFLQNLVLNGQALTSEQKAEAAMFVAVNDWETRMIEAREAAILSGGEPQWPAPPDGIMDFLTGF